MPADITKIGNYDVVDVIGEGGMGVVYKGWDPRFSRPVAIKMMTTGFSKNEEALRRFYHEAKALGGLQQSNIVSVYDLGDQDGTPYLVMEYLDGESLDKVIASRREQSIVEKLHIIVKVLRALDYAHRRGVVHRDVKPGNVMVMPDGDCKLVDFGIARMGDTNLTHTGQIVGSMSYMSPEQLNGYDVDGRTDVWSAAVLFYQLLTFHQPFEGRDTSALIVKILSENPPPLSKYIDLYYPPELDDIIARALAKDREARYASADEFAFDLEHVEGLLKAQMVSEYVEQARAAMDSDLGRARELLSRVLKVDTQNSTAKQILYQVQQLMHQQQRAGQVQALRSQAEEALSKANWEDALSLVDQALKIDQTNLDLVGLRDTVLRTKARKEQVLKLVHLAEVAHQQGELEMARRAVDDALALNPNDTQAMVLNSTLVREIELRRRYEELLASVRSEIAASRLEEAARKLREAEVLCPQGAEIAGLKKLILAEHEEQLRANRFEVLKLDAEQLLAREQFMQAQAKAEEALRYDSSNRGMLDLLERIKTQQRNHWVAQQLASSEKLVAEGRITAALTLIETAAAHFNDSRLQARIPALREKQEQQRRATALTAAEAAQRKQVADTLNNAQREELRLSAQRAESKVPREPSRVEVPIPVPLPQTPTEDWSATRLFSPDGQSSGAAAAPALDLLIEKRTAETVKQPKAAAPPAVKPPDVKAPPSPVPAPGAAAAPLKPAPRSPKVWVAAGVAAAFLLGVALYVFIPSAASVNVNFESEPTGVEVSTDGRSCKTPCALNLKLGDHAVKATLDGYDALEKQVSVGKVPQTVAIALTPQRPVLGSLQVQTNIDNVDLLVDGVRKGVSAGKSTTLSLVPGNYKIRAEKPGYDPAEQSVEIVKSGVANVQLTLNKAQGVPRAAVGNEANNRNEPVKIAPPKTVKPPNIGERSGNTKKQASDLAAKAQAQFDNSQYAVAVEMFQEAVQLDGSNSAAKAGLKKAQKAEKAEESILGDR